MNNNNNVSTSVQSSNSLAYSPQNIANQVQSEPNGSYDGDYNNRTSSAASVEIPAFGIKMKKIYNLYNGQSLENIDIINDLRKPPKFRRRIIKDGKMKDGDSSSTSSINDNDMSDSQSISSVLLSMKEGHPISPEEARAFAKRKPGRKPKPRTKEEEEAMMNVNDPITGEIRKKRKYTKRKDVDKNKLRKSSINPKVAALIDESKKILSDRSIEELDLTEKIDLLPNSLINLLKNGKYAIVKYHGSTECIGIQKCDTMLGKKELKKIKELQFNSDELETSKALRIKFENDNKKSQHRFLIITPVVWKHWDWFNLHNAEIDYTKQQ